MSRFEGTFQGRTTGGDGLKVTAGGVLALAGGVLVLTHRHQAAQDAGTAAVICAATFGAVLVAVVVFVVLRLRGHRRDTGGERRPSLLLCHVSPQPVPAREAPRAVAAPVQPIVNINLGPDLIAALLAAAQPQPVRVVAEPIEQQEIPR